MTMEVLPNKAVQIANQSDISWYVSKEVSSSRKIPRIIARSTLKTSTNISKDSNNKSTNHLRKPFKQTPKQQETPPQKPKNTSTKEERNQKHWEQNNKNKRKQSHQTQPSGLAPARGWGASWTRPSPRSAEMDSDGGVWAPGCSGVGVFSWKGSVTCLFLLRGFIVF